MVEEIPKELKQAPTESERKLGKGKLMKPPPKGPAQTPLAELVQANLKTEAKKQESIAAVVDLVNDCLAELPAGVSRDVVLDRCRVAPSAKPKKGKAKK